ncbi:MULTISPECIES: class I SAM-dependent methyltransferase [Arsenicicoccus]|uniref:class I SAM-dependent methyltransferase n=1 Tax=Arsenicicoccus TaxID=267408 RepID=UPI000414C25D|nr:MULTISPECIES: class I SAM-dependent methyltransferase [Arsenicicoccus]
MSEHEEHHHHPAPMAQTAEDWDERYSGEQVWSGNPNEALVVESKDLAPGRVLDVGCGEGADAVWLAHQGWEVTALDISSRAVERTLAAGRQAGMTITGVAAPLLEADLEQGSFDLVSAMYPALMKVPTHDAEQRLAELVAPGGTLLVVHHGDIDRELSLSHGFDPDEYVAPADVAAALGEEWEVVVHEQRDRDVALGAGSHHKSDIVLRATRRAQVG